MVTNASFLYYRSKNFGKNLNEKKIEELLGILDTADYDFKKIKISNIPYLDFFKICGTMKFSLKTTYPGLIIGSGYNHPADKFEEGQPPDFQLGFYFDNTTGMPVIPGSTVKGTLKSIFPKEYDTEEIKIEKLKYINTILGKENLIKRNNWKKLFEKGNIFFDAYISEIPDSRKIFAEDYITPHTKGPFKNPIPIRFLKIAPGVTFTFQFKIKDSVLENEKRITINEKICLFKKILLDYGIGAKRNVGYGYFILENEI